MMPPDIDSLSSRSTFRLYNNASPSEVTNNTPSPSPRSSVPAISTAPTNSMSNRSSNNHNTNHRRSHSSRSSISEHRRRSAGGTNFGFNDSGGLARPGEIHPSDHRSSTGYALRNASPTNIGGSHGIGMGDPHHHRTPSLGEIHQELEQEQEAQVNRLLQMIRSQQLQLQQIQQQQQQQHSSTLGTAVVDDWTPTFERSVSISSASAHHPRPSADPHHASHGSEWSVLAGGEGGPRQSSRDESVYIQAEAAMLSRENQMLRMRIRELERQISEIGVSGRPSAAPSSQAPLRTADDTESSGQSYHDGPEPSISLVADAISEVSGKT